MIGETLFDIPLDLRKYRIAMNMVIKIISRGRVKASINVMDFIESKLDQSTAFLVHIR